MKPTNSNIATTVLAQSFALLEKWQELPQLDLHLNDMRRDQPPEISKKVFALCREYFRNKAMIDGYIAQSCTKRPRRRLQQILRVCFTQILLQDRLAKEIVADVAVAWTKKRFNKHEANFINGVLRKFNPEACDPTSLSKAAQLGLQEDLYKRWNNEFGADKTAELAEAISKPAAVTARLLNETLDVDPQWKKLSQQKWFGSEQFYEITNASEFFKKGDMDGIYIQDPATMASLSLLKPQEGEEVADVCAAPGGKSVFIAQKIGDKGLLHSCDLSEARLKTLEENLADYSNVKFLVQDATQPSLKEESLDALLLDVPCSNTGVIRRKPDVQWSFSEQKVKELVEIQAKILQACSKLIKKDGRLIYSTCSIEFSENEKQVEKFLSKNPNFECIEQTRLFPYTDHDGAFAAVLKRIS